MAWAFQRLGTYQSASAVTSMAFVHAGAVVGDRLMLGIWLVDPHVVNTVSDGSNTWHLSKRFQLSGGGGDLEIWTAQCTTGGSLTITATPDSATDMGGQSIEYSGLDTSTTPESSTGAAGNTAAEAAQAATLAAADASGELLLGILAGNFVSGLVFSVTNSLANLRNSNTDIWGIGDGSGTGAADTGGFSWTGGTTAASVAIAAYKLALAAGKPIKKYPLPWELLPNLGA